MLLNNSRPPFDDPLVRQAIQHAVDTPVIVDGVYEGIGDPAAGPFGPDTDWAPEAAEPVAQDLDEARALLDEAGVDPESLSIELLAYNDGPEFPDVAAVLQAQLGELGIEVKIRAGEYASLEPDLLSGIFDATPALPLLPGRRRRPRRLPALGLGLRRWVQHRSLLRPGDRPDDPGAVGIGNIDERNAVYQEFATSCRARPASSSSTSVPSGAPRPTSRTPSPTRWTTTSSPRPRPRRQLTRRPGTDD